MSDTPEYPSPEAPPAPALPPLPPPRPPQVEVSAAVATRPQVKSTALATLLAFIPFGLGHLYLGLYGRAVLLFGAFWFAVFLELPVIAAFVYFFTVVDAMRQSQLMNLHGVEASEPAPLPGQGGLVAGVFLVVAGAVLLLRNWIDVDRLRELLQDYSPVLLVVIGVYLIAAAIHDRARKRRSAELAEGD